MKNHLFYMFLLFACFTHAQDPKTEFNKSVDSINTIIASNKNVYFIDNQKNGAFVKQIRVNENGAVTFIDSIPAIDKTITKNTNPEHLIPDCCPSKNTRILNLFEIKKWNIHFPYIKLLDKNNKVYGQFYGIREKDISFLKEQFDKLTVICVNLN